MSDILGVLRDLAGPLGLGGLLLYYVRDRRKQRLADELAEQTLGPTVVKAGAEGFQAQLLAVEAAMESERRSKDNVVKDLEARIASRDAEIAMLRDQVATLTQQVHELAAQVRAHEGGR